jgi:hypothetical protein
MAKEAKIKGGHNEIEVLQLLMKVEIFLECYQEHDNSKEG